MKEKPDVVNRETELPPNLEWTGYLEHTISGVLYYLNMASTLQISSILGVD